MIRKAAMGDVKEIKGLIDHYAEKGDILPRSLSEIYDGLRDFWVWEERGKVVGCAALHIAWEDLAEVKSLAVGEGSQGKGIGEKLLKACVDEAGKLKIRRVFVLTERKGFFQKRGFKLVEKSELPHKVWSESIRCTKFPDCNEVALILDSA